MSKQLADGDAEKGAAIAQDLMTESPEAGEQLSGMLCWLDAG
jgi:hypothetical protein